VPERSEYIYRRDSEGEIRRGCFFYPEKPVHCMDCGQDVTNEFFMIHGPLWAQAVKGKIGWICVPCLEHRMGRRLQREDFTLCPANVTTFRKTERLLERMGGEPLDEDLLL
jgi:hypothetical protein